jgi:hypothetical protein
MSDWLDIFSYSDGRLLWKKRRCPRVAAGSVAGYKNRHGYIKVEVLGRVFPVQKIIWEIHFGRVPEGLIVDHIDGDRDNNRIENLRLADHSQNAWNRGISKANTSGFKGVTLERVKLKRIGKTIERWVAQIRTNGKNRKIGRFSSKQEAAEAYRLADLAERGEFSAYACRRW